MGIALLYPEPDGKGGRGKKKAPETGGFSRQRLGDARAVLRFSRELALAVRDGSRKLENRNLKNKVLKMRVLFLTCDMENGA